MKQVTIRLNEAGEKELKKIQELLGTRSAQATIEQVLLVYRSAIEKQAAAEKELVETKAILKYIENGKI